MWNKRHIDLQQRNQKNGKFTCKPQVIPGTPNSRRILITSLGLRSMFADASCTPCKFNRQKVLKQVIFFDRCLIRVVSKQQQVNICGGQTGATVFFAVMFVCLHLHRKERYRSSRCCQEDVHMNKHGYVSVDELIALREKEHGKTTSLWWHVKVL